MTIYNPNREERAFLYQEAQDLEPLIKELGSLTVVVEERATDERGRFRVTFVIAPDTYAMRVPASHADLFSATIAAKEETLRQLNSIVNSMPRPNAVLDPGLRPPHEVLH